MQVFMRIISLEVSCGTVLTKWTVNYFSAESSKHKQPELQFFVTTLQSLMLLYRIIVPKRLRRQEEFRMCTSSYCLMKLYLHPTQIKALCEIYWFKFGNSLYVEGKTISEFPNRCSAVKSIRRNTVISLTLL